MISSKSSSPYSLSPKSVRRSPRYEVKAWVDMSNNQALAHHPIQNLSLGGICIRCDFTQEIGTQVDLVIHLPEVETPLSVPGEVVWANRTVPQDMGIRFVALTEEDALLLKGYIQHLQNLQALDLFSTEES